MTEYKQPLLDIDTTIWFTTILAKGERSFLTAVKNGLKDVDAVFDSRFELRREPMGSTVVYYVYFGGVQMFYVQILGGSGNIYVGSSAWTSDGEYTHRGAAAVVRNIVRRIYS